MALLLFAVLGLSSCRGAAASPPPELLIPVGAQIQLDTAIVTRGPVADVEQHLVIVRKESQAINFGPMAAVFEAFYVMPGDTVSYGQRLASLNMTQLERQITQQEERIARLRRDNARSNELRRLDIAILALELEAAEASAITTEAARLAGAITRGRLELELAQERQALQLRHEEADLQSLLARLAQSGLYAPLDGTVVYVPPRAYGSWVAPFEPIIYIAPVDANIFLEYTGGSTAMPGVRFQAHIGGEIYNATRISITREQAQRYERTPIRFALELAPGMAPPPVGAIASLHTYRRWEEDALRLPRNTLFFIPDVGFYVYRVENGQREMVIVSVGIRTDTYVEILWGVAEGDEIYVRS